MAAGHRLPPGPGHRSGRWRVAAAAGVLALLAPACSTRLGQTSSTSVPATVPKGFDNTPPAPAPPSPPGAVQLRVPAIGPVDARVDLRVLVVTDGQESVEAIAAQLEAEGVPVTKVALSDPARPRIDAAFLADTVDGRPRARYQAVVLPDEEPFPDGSGELAVLHDYERRFGVRQVDAFSNAGASVGLAEPQAPDGWSGPLDGTTLSVTPEGRAGPFSYLRGPVPVEDRDPAINEAYAYLAPPRPAPGRTFTSLVEATIPGTTRRAPVVGVLAEGGREEMAITMAHNAQQFQDRLLAHGVVTWMTKGVHLGFYRNAFTAQIDDVFLSNGRWVEERKCTTFDDCPADVTAPVIRMTADDVRALVDWQRRSGLRLDLAFNGGGSELAAKQSGGTDPVLAAFEGHVGEFHWINHTYAHRYFGCVRSPTTPRVCETDPATGDLRYLGASDIAADIAQNLVWARAKGIPVNDTHEVVTGEHSGLFFLPAQPKDNPELAPALAAAGVTLLASDASRDLQPRPVGGATTLPRWPTDLFVDVGTAVEEVEQYNWRYTDTAAGGSGFCREQPTVTTCLPPLDPATGYQAVIVPRITGQVLRRVLSNDPRPYYFHENNLAEERLLYPLLDEVARRYRDAFDVSAPIWQPSYRESSTWMARQRAWRAAPPSAATAYVIGDVLRVETTVPGLAVPVTAPERTTWGAVGATPFGDAYAGERSAWVEPGAAPAAATATTASSSRP